MTDVPPADPESVARTIVLRRLTVAPRTRAELAKSLHEKSVPPDIAESVLDRFTELGLIDDIEYAVSFTESRRLRQGWSRRAIAAKLRDRGVPRDIAEQALEVVEADDERHTALDLGRRRWERMSGVDVAVRRRRLSGMLARRGYSYGVIAAVLAQIDADADANDDVC